MKTSRTKKLQFLKNEINIVTGKPEFAGGKNSNYIAINKSAATEIENTELSKKRKYRTRKIKKKRKCCLNRGICVLNFCYCKRLINRILIYNCLSRYNFRIDNNWSIKLTQFMLI